MMPNSVFSGVLDDMRGVNDLFIHNSNAFARLMHDQIIASADAYGYGQINPIVDDIFELPAPGWEYTERFGYHPNVPSVSVHCFKSDTPIQMWPLDPSIKPRADGTYDERLVLSKVWEKPISEIKVGDLVVAYDDKGRLAPKPVTRTMTNMATHVLDFWNTGVTPGHAYYCADGKFKGHHVPIMDILRTDGTMLRAATCCEVGSMGDMVIHASATQQRSDGTWTDPKPGKIRFGTQIIRSDGQYISLMELAATEGWRVSDDGYMVGMMKGEDGTLREQTFLFPYVYGKDLPKPEDYILERSDVTLEAIFAY
ncbi:hypothetical protein [Cochlodiniinecator piscidefendens]|uniref:hypothetical protein n=1 Tax=Cochlodiniinecator piscidefendens TaxID=2715756 RepID=UPI00140E35EC|nr:hypothetical protein [Cochlodiniinecator piscidefendens]